MHSHRDASYRSRRPTKLQKLNLLSCQRWKIMMRRLRKVMLKSLMMQMLNKNLSHLYKYCNSPTSKPLRLMMKSELQM
uniref:Uncharacterized protein n=1 Tax=Picea sitchensis TaxID=3332 RepID=A9NQR2_PICSI|nr:unknown [Picea sitchensis]